MNYPELWETTMNPATRTLRQVTLDDAATADELFSVLMGEDVEARRVLHPAQRQGRALPRHLAAPQRAPVRPVPGSAGAPDPHWPTSTCSHPGGRPPASRSAGAAPDRPPHPEPQLDSEDRAVTEPTPGSPRRAAGARLRRPACARAGGRVEPVGIEVEMQRSYLDYAMSVIVGRALPDVRDGLKPVHRKILYGHVRRRATGRTGAT